jgi:hypothetical protein
MASHARQARGTLAVQLPHFPYEPEPSDFDRYGQYFWLYGGWYIIWYTTTAVAVVVTLDLILFIHSDPGGEPTSGAWR